MLGEGVGEAVAEVQTCRMAAPAEPAKGFARYERLLRVERNDLDRELVQKSIELPDPTGAAFGFDDNAAFPPSRVRTSRSAPNREPFPAEVRRRARS
jgi:hypothetical protein